MYLDEWLQNLQTETCYDVKKTMKNDGFNISTKYIVKLEKIQNLWKYPEVET